MSKYHPVSRGPSDAEKLEALTEKFNNLITALQEYADASNDQRLGKLLTDAGFASKTASRRSRPGWL